ncbi:unnamed protein product [Arabidopsis halleri]
MNRSLSSKQPSDYIRIILSIDKPGLVCLSLLLERDFTLSSLGTQSCLAVILPFGFVCVRRSSPPMEVSWLITAYFLSDPGGRAKAEGRCSSLTSTWERKSPPLEAEEGEGRLMGWLRHSRGH